MRAPLEGLGAPLTIPFSRVLSASPQGLRQYWNLGWMVDVVETLGESQGSGRAAKRRIDSW